MSGAGTWADKQSDAPSRSEALRRLVKLALADYETDYETDYEMDAMVARQGLRRNRRPVC